VPTRQGFDFFFGYLNQRHAHNYYPSFLIRNETRVRLPNVVPKEDKVGAGQASVKKVYSHDLILAEGLKFIEESAAKRQPFFLYASVTLPHANNEARNEGMEVPDYGQYADLDWPEPQKGHAAMITRLDTGVGKILDLLDKLDLADNTLVIFTSDNGPHREGGANPDFNDSNGPLKGIKRSLHDGGIRVPTIVRWPGKVEPGSESDLIAGTPRHHADAGRNRRK
jgi:arylsulfatase A-like enzyme